MFSTCGACEGYHYELNGKCVKSCPVGYRLRDGKCEEVKCKPGYYWSAGKCLVCEENS